MPNSKFYAVIYGTNENEQIEVFNDLEASDLFARNLNAAEVSHWQFAIKPGDGQRLHEMFTTESRQFIGGSICDRGNGPDLTMSTPDIPVAR